MYSAVTRDIEVTVRPAYDPDGSDAEAGRHVWAYHVAIHNRGRVAVQLVSRHWRIVDGLGRVEEVRGLGVVGRQPMIVPGETFRYASRCPLPTTSGVMSGHYVMVLPDRTFLTVAVPAFSLDLPDRPRTVH